MSRVGKQPITVADGIKVNIHTDKIELKSWRWAHIDKVVPTVHERRKERTKIYINKLKELL